MLAVDLWQKNNRAKWQTYWIIYVAFQLFEYFTSSLLNSLKLYWLGKCLFLLWLMFSDEAVSFLQRFIISIGRKKTGFTINPPSENIELHITKMDNKTVQTRLRPNSQGFVNVHCLDDGHYEIEVYSLFIINMLLLHRFQITVRKGTVNVQAVDVNATVLHVTFRKNDKPFDGAQVHGRFVKPEKTIYNLIGQTDSNGVIQIPLPEGAIYDFMATKDGFEVKKRGYIPIPQPSSTPVNIPRQPKFIIIDIDSSTFSSSINPMEANARVVILGDISGSMDADNKMEILKRSYWEIFEKCHKNGWSVSIASWDTSLEWCTNQWIQSSQTNFVKSWIQKQNARGGNDMRNAIERCMEHHPDATDVYVMCDGDITPFYAIHFESELAKPWSNNYSNADWRECRKKFPQTKFHFIALGDGAACEPMEAMASIGDGIFHQAT